MHKCQGPEEVMSCTRPVTRAETRNRGAESTGGTKGVEAGGRWGMNGDEPIGATLYVTMVTCHHHFFKVEFIPNTNFSLYFGQENRIFLATRSVQWPKICRKCDSGLGSAPDPAGGAHDAPPDP